MSLLEDIAAKVKAALGTNSQASGMVDHLLAWVHNTPASGGLTGIIKQCQNSGLGPVVQSWISTGPNQPVTAEQIAQIAAKLGLPVEVVAQRVAEVLPHLIDHLTPGGNLHPSMANTGQMASIPKTHL
jgi:uncharacterized protein YidB (DUF937 family)